MYISQITPLPTFNADFFLALHYSKFNASAKNTAHKWGLGLRYDYLLRKPNCVGIAKVGLLTFSRTPLYGWIFGGPSLLLIDKTSSFSPFRLRVASSSEHILGDRIKSHGDSSENNVSVPLSVVQDVMVLASLMQTAMTKQLQKLSIVFDGDKVGGGIWKLNGSPIS